MRILLSIFLLVVTRSYSFAYGCSYPPYETPASITAKADTVFAAIVREELPWDNHGYDFKFIVEPVKTYKGYVEDELVTITVNVNCEHEGWLSNINKIGIIAANGYGKDLFVTSGLSSIRQKDLANYLEKGVFRSVDKRKCEHRPFGMAEVDHPDYPANSKYSKVSCYGRRSNSEELFRFIPPMPPVQ